MHTRNGKIARLPKAIREKLNERLEEGVPGRELVAWLNSLPEVRAILDAHFAGAEIREQNLSEWKKGGFQEWLRHQEALALAERLYERAEEMKEQGENQMPMNEVLSLWLGARYAVATQEIEAMDGVEGWKLLRQMCVDVAKLTRLQQQAERIELEAEKVELKRQEVGIEQARWKEEKRQMRERFAAEQEAREREEEERRSLTDEERARRIAEIYGRWPEPGRAAESRG